MHVAVGDVSPHREIEIALGEQAAARRIMSPKRSNGTIMSAAVFEIAGSRLLRQRDAAIDAGRHRFAQLGERRGPRAIARQRDLRIVEHAVSIEQPAEPRQRRIRGAGLAATIRVAGQRSVGGMRVRQLEIDQQRDRRARRQRDVELAIDAVFADHCDRSRIEVLDGDDVDAVRIARTPGRDRGRAQLGRRARSRVPRSAPARTRGTGRPAAARS